MDNNFSSYSRPLKEFNKFLEEHNLFQLVTSPTHNSGNILDLVITSKPQSVSSLELLEPFTSSCDHNMIALTITTTPITKTKRKPKRNFNLANFTQINTYLSTINWDAVFHPYEDINKMYSNFLEIIHKSIELYVPMSKVKQRTRLPKSLIKLLRIKRKLYKKSKVNKSFKLKFKKQERIFKIALQSYRYQCEQNILNSGSKKLLYNHINQKLHMRHQIPPLLNSVNGLCLDSKEKANLFNSTFSKVFLQDDLDTTPPNMPLNNSHIIQNSMQSITSLEIHNCILKLNNSISQTPDSVPAIYIKKTSSQLLQPLLCIFNHSLHFGDVPSLWKTAIVKPIYKKGKINNPKNYRPISLTSVICRLLEKIVHNRLLTHLLNNNIISKAQHGFIVKRSTQTQQLYLLDKLTHLYDNNTQAEVIYLDFSKAFDKVSHTKLIYLLNYYQLDHKLIKWISQYLKDRSQTTVVEHNFSDRTPVTSGVPQGSVLGPLLFLVYLESLIATIHLHCKYTTVFAYADDIKLLSTDSKDLQLALDIVGKWTHDWKLLLNNDKSEHFTIRNKHPVSFNINGNIIKRVHTVRDLGITLSDNLKWNHHIHKIRAKANITGHTLLKTFISQNPKLLINLFKTYVRPILEYNTCTWSPNQLSDIKEIESVQRIYTRKVFQRCNLSFSSYADRLTKIKLESLYSRRIKNDLILVYKIIHNLIDVEFANFFQFSHFGNHSLRRHSQNLSRQNISKTTCRRNFFSHRVVHHWNQLSQTLISSPSLSSFKFGLRSMTFDM